MTWYQPAPGTTAHRIRTTVRAAAASGVVAYLLALSHYIPC